MKSLIFIFCLFLVNCASEPVTRNVWDNSNPAKFKRDWDHCTSLAISYDEGAVFRERCMTANGNNIKQELVGK